MAVGMPEFTPPPIAGGVWGYHSNQFRGYFRAPKLTRPFPHRTARLAPRLPGPLGDGMATVAEDFQGHFSDYFNGETAPMKHNIADVRRGDGERSYGGLPLLRFVIQTNVKKRFGDIHSDWVALVKQQAQGA